LSHDHYKSVRYNRGMLCKEKRALGTVWVFRWSEELNGRRRQHKDVIGTTKQFPHRSGRQQGSGPTAAPAQRKQTILEFEIHHV
jgi:hypothetical protein